MCFTKKNLASLMATSLLGLSAAAFADVPPTDTTTVTITATVVDNTCEVDTAQKPWALGSPRVDDIMRNAPAAQKAETITLKNCGSGVKSVTVTTDTGKADASGMIANQLTNTSAAQNVVAEILGKDNSSVLTPTSPLTYPLKAGGDNDLAFNVKLKQSGGKPTAGDFQSSVVLNLAYE